MDAGAPTCADAFSLVITAAPASTELEGQVRVLLGFVRDGNELPIVTSNVLVPGFAELRSGGKPPSCNLSGRKLAPGECVETYFYPFSSGPVLAAIPTPTALPTPSGDPVGVASLPATPACVLPGGQAPVYCSFSPDGRWMTYPVEAGELTLASGYVVPLWDQWVLEVAAGQAKLLQTGLVHCGGCDARYGPKWSPSSRYVAYAEYGGDGRRFLSDVTTGATRQIGTGAEVDEAPVWSPHGNRLLYQVEDNGTAARLEDLVAKTTRELTILWPAAFDTSGTLIYSPAYGYNPKAPPPSTTIADAASGRIVATLEGAPPQSFAWSPGIAVAARDKGFVAALQGAPGCAGTAIYTAAGAPPQCISTGVEGRAAPDGAQVAVARVTGSVGTATAPGGSAVTMTPYAIDVVTPGGPTTTVVTDAVSPQAPRMVWNAAGTHLLVLWPHAAGL